LLVYSIVVLEVDCFICDNTTKHAKLYGHHLEHMQKKYYINSSTSVLKRNMDTISTLYLFTNKNACNNTRIILDQFKSQQFLMKKKE